MSKFDFINEPPFRDSLERDYSEMQNCLKNEAWKGAQVLAGSIVEALIVDHIIATKVSIPNSKDPLRLELSEAVAISRNNKSITDRTADLCSVVRSYRNLIHPGRQIRLDEPQPTQQSAQIASTLVELIIEDLANARRVIFGLTAEQIVAKLENDHNSITLLPHILKEIHKDEVERILSGVLTSRYFYLDDMIANTDDESSYSAIVTSENRLARGFRIILNSAPDDIKQKAAARFLAILKNEGGSYSDTYAESFFSAGDIKYLPVKDQPIVKEYLFSKLPPTYDSDTAKRAQSLSIYVEPSNINVWTDPFVRAIVSDKIHPDQKQAIRKSFLDSQTSLTTEAKKALDDRLSAWKSQFSRPNQVGEAEQLKTMQSDVALVRLLWH